MVVKKKKQNNNNNKKMCIKHDVKMEVKEREKKINAM